MNLRIFITALLLLILCSACKKTKTLQINLYLGSSLSESAEEPMPPVVLQLLKPRGCEGQGFNYLTELQVHRYDFGTLKSETVKIPLTGVNKMRENLNTAGYAHYAGEFESNSQNFKATELLYSKSPKTEARAMAAVSKKISAAGQLIIIGTADAQLQKKAMKVLPSIDSLDGFLEQQICNGKLDDQLIHVLYNAVKEENEILIPEPPTAMEPDTIEPSPSVVNQSPGLEKAFQDLGNIRVSPDERLAMVDDVMSTYFTDDADVKEFGKNGTLVGLTPARSYLERIALYKSLEKIEVKDALKKQDGKYWEVHVVEHHLHD